MNKEDLLKHRDKLPKDMYVILLKPEGDDNISLAIFDTHSNTKVSTVDLAYTLSRGVLSYLTNDMETIKERGQSVILSELLEFTNLPVTDLLKRQVGGNHYMNFAIMPIEYISKNNLDFLEGNIIKYISRHKHKNGAEDIKKVIHYAELILEIQYGEK
jgi:hypothetical protein